MDYITIYYAECANESSHSLLVNAASVYSGLHCDSFIISSEIGKKPYFSSHPDIHFSISHSKNIWAAAFSCNEVGLDIQYPNNNVNHDKVAKRYFHPNEYKKYTEGESFYSVWTRKEAVCKMFGFGIDSRFSRIDTYSDNYCTSPFTIKTILPKSDNTPFCSIAFGKDFEYNIVKLI